MINKFDSYKAFIRNWIELRPNKGRGEIAKIASFLNISPSLVSAILTSDRQFSSEQAYDLCEYLGLTTLESEYFMAMVSTEKSGSLRLKKYWQQQQKKLSKDLNQIRSQVKYEKVLDVKDQNIYYAHALYSQIRVLCTLENGVSTAELVKLLKASEKKIKDVVEFLIDKDLIINKSGRYFATEKVIHISKDSPNYLRHHMNWRILQLNQISLSQNDDLTYTFPCTLSHQDFKKVMNRLVETIASCQDTIRQSPAEELACLTIDFISYSQKA